MNEFFVENLISTLLLEFKNHDRKGVYAWTQKVMAYNSNKIEGSTLTSEQTASLFDTGTFFLDAATVYRSKDVEEMTGHFELFNYMLKTLDEPLSETMIKKYHYYLKNGVFEDKANGYPIGEYKNRNNIVSDIITTPATEVPCAMNKLLSSYTGNDLKSILAFHASFEYIHPFQDGNGRVGRMIMFRECLKCKIVPLIIRDDSKNEYYHVLHGAQIDGDFQPLEKYAARMQEVYLSEIKDMIKER